MRRHPEPTVGQDGVRGGVDLTADQVGVGGLVDEKRLGVLVRACAGSAGAGAPRRLRIASGEHVLGRGNIAAVRAGRFEPYKPAGGVQPDVPDPPLFDLP